MAPPGDEALYASPPSSPGPAIPPLRATLLDKCDVVSPLSLPEAHFPSVLSTHREKPDLGAASQLPFTIPTPSPPAPRRRKDIAQDINCNDEYHTNNNLDSYTMTRSDPRRMSSLQNEYEYHDTSSDDSHCGSDELSTARKLSDTSSKGDPVLFRPSRVNVGIICSDLAHPNFGNLMASDKPPLNSKGRKTLSEETSDDRTLHEPTMSSATPASLPYRPKLPPLREHDNLRAEWNEHLTHSSRFNALRSSSNQASAWGSSLYGGFGSGSGVGSSSAAGRVWSGACEIRQRDFSMPTTHMPSSPPQLYCPTPARAINVSPSPADVASIFAQRGHANANRQPPVRPFEPAQFILDPYQSFSGPGQISAPFELGYAVGAPYGAEHIGLAQTRPRLPHQTLGSSVNPCQMLPSPYNRTASSFDPLARDFVPYQPRDDLGHQQRQPYLQPYQLYCQPPPPRLPLPPPPPPYKGARLRPPSRGDTSHGNPHISTHLNTCLWIEGCPPSMTYPDLLSSIRHCGRIYCTYINLPRSGHLTSACKVAFFSRQGAERLFEQCMRGEFVIGGVQARRVTWNRNAYSGHPDPTATRVLLIRGPAKWVNLYTLTHYFHALFWWHIISIDYIPLDVAAKMVGDEGWLENGLKEDLAEEYREMAAMRWEFASFHAQAQAAKLACERETAFMELVRVDYLPDGCDYTG